MARKMNITKVITAAAIKKAKASKPRPEHVLAAICGNESDRPGLELIKSNGKQLFAASSLVALRVDGSTLPEGYYSPHDIAAGKVAPGPVTPDVGMPAIGPTIDSALGEANAFIAVTTEALTKLATYLNDAKSRGAFLTIKLNAKSGDFYTTSAPLGIAGKGDEDDAQAKDFTGIMACMQVIEPVLLDRLTGKHRGKRSFGKVNSINFDGKSGASMSGVTFDKRFILAGVADADTYEEIRAALEKVRVEPRYAPFLHFHRSDFIMNCAKYDDATIDNIEWLINEFLEEIEAIAKTPEAQGAYTQTAHAKAKLKGKLAKPVTDSQPAVDDEDA